MNPLIKTAEKIGATKKKARKVVRGWKFRLFAILIGFSLVGAVCFSAFYNASKWYDQHQVNFHSPIEIKFFPIIKITKRTNNARLSQNNAKFEVSTPLWDDQEFLTNIYELTRRFESNYGRDTNDPTATHSYCQSINKINEIGYLVDSNRQFCFKSYYEQETTFKKWFAKRLKEGLTPVGAICLYTTGKVQVQCLRSMDMGL